MKIVIPLEKMRNETIKMIAEDLGYKVYSEEAEKILKETRDPVKIKKAEERTVAELQKCMLEDGYILTDDIYHIYDEDIYGYLLSKESKDTLMRMIEIYNGVNKLPIEDKLKKSILEECFMSEVYNRLAAGLAAYLEDNCWVDRELSDSL